MNDYLTMQRMRLEHERDAIVSSVHANAVRVIDAAHPILRYLEVDDLKAARTRVAELAQLLPQYLAPIDEHLKEAEIVARFAANMECEEPAR